MVTNIAWYWYHKQLILTNIFVHLVIGGICWKKTSLSNLSLLAVNIYIYIHIYIYILREISHSWVDSLVPGKVEWNFRHVIFKQIVVSGGWGIACEIALIWMSLDFTDDQSTLIQVVAWCRSGFGNWHLPPILSLLLGHMMANEPYLTHFMFPMSPGGSLWGVNQINS